MYLVHGYNVRDKTKDCCYDFDSEEEAWEYLKKVKHELDFYRIVRIAEVLDEKVDEGIWL